MPAVATLRAVVVTRPTEYEGLLAEHATRQHARFFLSTRGQALEPVERRHALQTAALERVSAAIPADWRRARVDRADLDRFLFEPDDVVVVLGQDGLVANVAKYLSGQPVIGLNPDPERNEGALVRHPVRAAPDLIADAAAGRLALEERAMVAASAAGGPRLVALNEVFFGHPSHQSARYRLRVPAHPARGDGRGDERAEERQSSSGLIVATGTGASGWARSIHNERRCAFDLPRPDDRRLAWFVREAWPSVATGTELTAGLLAPGRSLEVVCEMDRGVVFGDGIESDHLPLAWGQPVTIARADEVLRLAV